MRAMRRPQWWFGMALGSGAAAIAFSIDWRLLGLVFMSELAGLLIWEATDV
jgi:hypothetical protein